MKLHLLPKLTTKKNKRLGQGYGTGKGGHTSSRGQKGQKSRGSIRLSFTGSSWVWFKRLPFIRGKARFSAIKSSHTITLTDLNKFKAGSTVSLSSLRDLGLIGKNSGNKITVRIVNTGTLTKKLTVHIPASVTAISSIKKAGGSHSVQSE